MQYWGAPAVLSWGGKCGGGGWGPGGPAGGLGQEGGLAGGQGQLEEFRPLFQVGSSPIPTHLTVGGAVASLSHGAGAGR